MSFAETQFQTDNYFTSALRIYYANVSGIYFQSRNCSFVGSIHFSLVTFMVVPLTLDYTFTVMLEFTFHLSCLISIILPICVDSYLSSFMANFQTISIHILSFHYFISPSGTLIRHIYLPWCLASFYFPTPWLSVFHSGKLL